MKTDRWLIASLISLTAGLWLCFAWCHGSVGLAFAYPLAGTKLSIDITSAGGVVLAGIPLVLLGVLLLVTAFLSAVVDQFRRRRSDTKEEKIAPPSAPAQS